MKKVIIPIVATLLVLGIAAGSIFYVKEKMPLRPTRETPPRSALTLWYEAPAAEGHDGWEKEALPIGNGYMGAKIFGGAVNEHLQFNEKTLWTGGPEIEGYNGGNSNPDGNAARLEAQRLLAEGKLDEATKAMEGLNGNDAGYGGYQNFGELYIDADGIGKVSDYIRDLDLETAISSVSFKSDDTAYKREYFASYPDNVLVTKLSSSGQKALRFQYI